MPIEPAPRLNGITGLRWWAAFAVFAHHFTNLAPLPPLVASYAKFGSLGVTFFFILSGFVLTWSWNPATDKRTFYWRRFARIYPLHLLALLLAIPVFYRLAPDPELWWIKALSVALLLLSVVLLQGWSRDPAILFSGNPAAWTLTVEAFFYALHPFVTAPLRRLSRNGALIAAGVTLLIAFGTRVGIILFPTSWLAGLPWPILHLNEFVLGMCIAWAYRQGFRLRVSPYIAIVALLGFFGALIALQITGHAFLYATVGAYINEIVTVLFALLIATVATRDVEGRAGWMAARPLVALGEWSFAFYLIHATLIYPVRELWGYQDGSYWRSLFWFVVLLGASIAASWALHSFLERPVERTLRRWQQNRRARRAARAEAEPALV